MRVTILGVAVIAATCLRAAMEPLPAQGRVPDQADSIAILHAAWRAATDGHPPRRALWLWVPSTPDSTSVVPLSLPLRLALHQRAIPAAAHRPAGDDTVVFRLTRWQADSAGVLIEFRSEWTTVLGRGDRQCRTGSGNVEQFRVRWQGGEWRAERAGPVLHGDRICRPLAPAADPSHGPPHLR